MIFSFLLAIRHLVPLQKRRVSLSEIIRSILESVHKPGTMNARMMYVLRYNVHICIVYTQGITRQSTTRASRLTDNAAVDVRTILLSLGILRNKVSIWFCRYQQGRVPVVLIII